ncbi:MAG: TetR/AcrR family transcriptional regulator [Bacteroidales bacterium]|jgi:AcrR family transcriptional regulator|nr:TetR/AcrR family transcriptional regulator [Bacteroidales bacterium]
MPRTKEQYEKIRSEKRALIKEKALLLFAEKGFDATSISDIARAAGISKGLMYNYFTSKEDLLQAVWDNLTEVFALMIDPDNDGEISDSEGADFIDKLFEHLINNRPLYKLYYQISFQPTVLNFLTTRYDPSKAQREQNRIIGYFRQKLPSNNMSINHFTVLVFLKGLALVSTYTESVYDNGFLMKYKEFLKECFSHN